MKSTSEFEVEKILEKKNIQNKTYYFVKWKGYDYSQSTWEPIENLLNCDEKILEYEKSKKILEEEGIILNEWDSKFYSNQKLKELILNNEIKRIINIREKNNILYALVEFEQNRFSKNKIPETYIPTNLLKTKKNINILNDFYESTIHFD